MLESGLLRQRLSLPLKGVTSSLTKFYYCVGALGCADTAQIVDLIEFTLDLLPYQSLKERLTKLHTHNPF